MNSDMQYVPTGVPGLDYVLMGGFLREGFYLVRGDPGSGKTTVAIQFVHGRIMAGEACLYITLTETRRDLENACRSHGWSLEGVEICDLTKSAANLTGEPESSVFHPSETELGETTKAIFAAVERAKPEHVVFDGLSEMRLLSGSRCCSTTMPRRSERSSRRAWSVAALCLSGRCPSTDGPDAAFT